MKKVYLFLATMVAALSSCMEESALVPVTPENQVTIKAVAGETKTTLDGTAVIWEANDEIAVVLDKNLVTFAVEGTPNGAEANFVGTIASKDFETAYAIYPATAYSYDQTTTKVTLTHTLPAEQSGSVASGLNLSTAALTVEDLKAGEAEGVFHNALTLLKVTAPAGVKNVKFSVPHSKPALVGTATVTVNTQTGFAAVSGANGYEVTLASGSELNPAVTYDVLVYPANSTDLTLTMEGTDGTVYTSTVEGVELKASTYKTINLANIFKMETKETMNISPAGGELVVPVYTAKDYTYEVTGCPSWLSCTLPTKGFHKDEIVFSAAANETGEERSASVTISWGDGQTRTFTVAQAAIFMDFVSDAEGNPIKWEETFGVYGSDTDALAGTNAKATFKNEFTIVLSDDFSKGTYKVSNIFKTDNIWLQGPTYPNQGGEYYADYVDGKLTLKLEGARKSYFFSSDIVLTYKDKAFTASDPIAFGANAYSSYNRAGFIGGYAAAVKVEEEPTPGQQTDPIAGDWDVTCMMGDSWGSNYAEKKGTMVISSSAGQYTLVSIAGIEYNLSLTFANNVLTGQKNGSTLKLTYDSATNTLTQDSNEFMTYVDPAFKGLIATKAVDLSGTYSGSGKYGSSAQYASSSFSETFTIQKNNDGKGQYVISGLFSVYGAYDLASTYYANYSGGTLTVLAANSSNHPYIGGSLQSDFAMSYSNGGFVLNGAVTLSPGMVVVPTYSATK